MTTEEENQCLKLIVTMLFRTLLEINEMPMIRGHYTKSLRNMKKILDQMKIDLEKEKANEQP